MAIKIALIGGGGVRTPLLIHGLAESGVEISSLTLYDIDPNRTEVTAGLGRLLAPFPVTPCGRLEDAVEGAACVLSSIRVGGIEARARDERIAIEHGFAGQETTGPGGAAMALRTVPAVLEHARVVERIAPEAWYVSFTNPAGLISQAVATHTKLRAIGICDTPSELFHQIARALGGPVECEYAGLNHLGWVRRVLKDGVDVTGQLLASDALLRGLYPADLFDPELIRTLELIPTEYLYFYYEQRRALRNQVGAGSTRGSEIEHLNRDLFSALAAAGINERLEIYRRYLMQRNASYLKLEAESGTAFAAYGEQPDPFAAATGYHRIAVDVLRGLYTSSPTQVVVNVPNHGAIDDLADEDVVEVACSITPSGAVPLHVGRLPESVRGLVLSVKAYERTLIRAAVEKSRALAQRALLEYPIVGQWEPAGAVLSGLIAADPELAYLRE
ncbi:MAG TPA: 6-phospho-beta-glucosidase [Bryobacteraceae bacterium]|nr:6-phospho-beta-glucosidase [Bryobacteraceae bacterium]